MTMIKNPQTITSVSDSRKFAMGV